LTEVTTGPALIRLLMNPALYAHPVERFELVETHISWVLLTGPYAYKIKKPVNLGFLDFSTLDQRRFYCEEELRLNRRLAPDLYLDVVPITGSLEAPTWGGAGPIIDYAVKMRQFPQEAQLDRVIAHGALHSEEIDALAEKLAGFHARAAVAPSDSVFGTPEVIARPIWENFEQIRECLADDADRRRHERLRAWSDADLAARRDDFLERKRNGCIRECHGDLHLANMVRLDGEIVIFDCLEFNERLRWIDVMSDAAFLLMDLDDRGYPGLAHRFLNAYLQAGGDYAGLRVLRSYRIYRALVRAKVACIRWRQADATPANGDRLRREFRSYTDLAERDTASARPFLVITHGYSGAGKTAAGRLVVEALGVLCVRSDLERRRLFGLGASTRSGLGIESGLYSPEASRQTYQRLTTLARTILEAGYSVIVDAACLQREQRDRLRALADQLRVPYVILDVTAPDAVLRERVRRREREGLDASEANLAVLDHQLATAEPLGPDEEADVVRVLTEEPVDPARLVGAIEHHIAECFRERSA
jgi:aminoglycoside phosphotransferase family enzyme/predicted kinase